MSQTRNYYNKKNDKSTYGEPFTPKFLDNGQLEWLIEIAPIGHILFTKGETGDRYHIYNFIKKSKNVIDIYQTFNQYDHGTQSGAYVGNIKDYVLTIDGDGVLGGWKGTQGDLLKNLLKKGIGPNTAKKHWKIKFCRNAYFMRTHDGNEFTPWHGIKVNLKTGLLVNKPNKDSKRSYNLAKEQDKAQRRRNYRSNKENTAALKRYREAGGDTELARRWNADEAETALNIAQMDWSKVPMDDVFKHRNATLRSNIIEHYGMNAIIETLEHEVVDEDVIDGRPYKLIDVTIPDYSDATTDSTSKGLYLEMLNPSTGESHFEGVPNLGQSSGWGARLTEATVKAALAWRDGDVQIRESETWRIGEMGSEDDYVTPVVLK
jgi:hypothetical protein